MLAAAAFAEEKFPDEYPTAAALKDKNATDQAWAKLLEHRIVLTDRPELTLTKIDAALAIWAQLHRGAPDDLAHPRTSTRTCTPTRTCIRMPTPTPSRTRIAHRWCRFTGSVLPYEPYRESGWESSVLPLPPAPPRAYSGLTVEPA